MGEYMLEAAFSTMQIQEKFEKSDPRWKEIGSSFVNMEVPFVEAASRIWTGHAFTVQLTKPWRDGKNFLLGKHLGLDFDSGTEASSISTLVRDPFIEKYATFVYSTYSARPSDGLHRTRVIFALDQPIRQPKNYVLAATALLWLFGSADPLCKDSVRQWFGTYQKDMELLGNVLPLSLVKDLVVRYQDTGMKLRKQYHPRPFNGNNDDVSLDRLVSSMASAAPGCRNATLNTTAFLLGKDIAEGRIDEDWGKQCLIRAAMATGLDEQEASYHTERGIESGKEANMMKVAYRH